VEEGVVEGVVERLVERHVERHGAQCLDNSPLGSSAVDIAMTSPPPAAPTAPPPQMPEGSDADEPTPEGIAPRVPAVGTRVASVSADGTLPKLGLGAPFRLGAGKKKVVVFGAPLGEYATVTCYGEQVPQVVVALWCALVATGGLETEGIFRLAGDAAACNAAEKLMGKGSLPRAVSPESIAHLIKTFLRKLPGGLLGKLPSDVITECDSDAGCERLLAHLDHRESAMLCWLLRVCVEVAQRKAVNKMDERNLCLVLAPNLFGPPNPTSNPMEELMLIKAATTTLHKLLMYATQASGQ